MTVRKRDHVYCIFFPPSLFSPLFCSLHYLVFFSECLSLFLHYFIIVFPLQKKNFCTSLNLTIWDFVKEEIFLLFLFGKEN